ncbi:MAG: hydantoinase B/oxoprolinase family protein [Acidimicrobiia bacterium]
MTSVDAAVTGEIVRNGLAMAAEEASVVVVRAGHSAFIQEGADACAAVLDHEAQLVALSTATSLMHAASLRCSLPALIEDFPLARMEPGDVYALNDPYRGGIHANDILVFRPVFADDGNGARVVFFTGTLIHVADVGGVAAGGLATLATDTFVEGLLLPPVRLYRRGEQQHDVFNIVARNSRAPEKVTGDVQALVAGTGVLARRVEELLDRYGAAAVVRVVRDAMDESERRMRASLAELPAGRYEGSFEIDTDGIEDRTFTVRAAVTLPGDGTIAIDLGGTSAQAVGAINASESQTMSGVVYAVRCFVDPTIPMNEGCFRPLAVDLPRGTLVNPEPPAACGGRLVTVAAVTEALLQALAAAQPEHAVAASALIHVVSLHGLRPTGEVWLTLLYEFGGLGARTGADGPDATGAFFLGGRSVIPQVEPLEAQFPFVVRSTRLLPDSGGRGRWRGGLGVETVVEMLDHAHLTVRGDRIGAFPPPGAQGGEPGRSGSFTVERADGRVEVLTARQSDVPLAPGDRFVLRTSGGGGLGPPAERDPAAVARDLAEGRVTP